MYMYNVCMCVYVVVKALGFDYDANFFLPLYQAMQGSYFVRLFLDQLFLGVVVLFVLLGCLLIYALLLSDVEEVCGPVAVCVCVSCLYVCLCSIKCSRVVCGCVALFN